MGGSAQPQNSTLTPGARFQCRGELSFYFYGLGAEGGGGSFAFLAICRLSRQILKKKNHSALWWACYRRRYDPPRRLGGTASHRLQTTQLVRGLALQGQ